MTDRDLVEKVMREVVEDLAIRLDPARWMPLAPGEDVEDDYDWDAEP